MKTLFSGTVLAIAASAASSSATAGSITIGSSLAYSCYEAAKSHYASRVNLQNCDLALAETALSTEDRVATHVNRGILYLIRRDYAVADQDFDMAIGLDPREPEAWLNKSIVRLNRGESAAAFPLVSRALELRTKRPALAFLVRGMAHENLGQLKAAYADLRQAQQLEPLWNGPSEELKRYRVRAR